MKLVREDLYKKPAPSRAVPLLIIIGILAAAGGTAGFLLFKRASKTPARTSKEFTLDPEKAEEIIEERRRKAEYHRLEFACVGICECGGNPSCKRCNP